MYREYKKPLPKFSDPEVWKKLKLECWDGTLEYEDFPPAEYKYFDRLRICYLEYKFNHLPEKEAKARERKLLLEYQQAVAKLARSAEVYRAYQNNIHLSELMRAGIEKAEHDDKLGFALKCIEALTGETGFAQRNMRRI